MGHSDDFEAMGDSLDRVERLLQIEEALLEAINADASLTASERDKLVGEIEARAETAFWNDEDLGDDDALAVYVRALGPLAPKGRSGGIALQPELEPADDSEDHNPTRLARNSRTVSGDVAGA